MSSSPDRWWAPIALPNAITFHAQRVKRHKTLRGWACLRSFGNAKTSLRSPGPYSTPPQHNGNYSIHEPDVAHGRPHRSGPSAITSSWGDADRDFVPTALRSNDDTGNAAP